jgi:phosphoglycolate phosphatase
MAAPRLLVFDLDGTLIDSSLDLCNSVNAALAFVGRPALPNDLIASYIGDGAAKLMRRALGDPGDLTSLVAQESDSLFIEAFKYFLEYYRAHKLDNTRCYQGVLEALDLIRQRHPRIPMAVLTNKPVNPSRDVCRALGLAPFFFQNYGGNSFPSKKPDPLGLLTLMREASALIESSGPAIITAPDVVMIGDSDVDVLTARRCGARAVGCLFGLSPQSLIASKPDKTVSHPSEWPSALGLA